MTRQRRNFDPSFKLEVGPMITQQGLSILYVSQSMDSGVSWIRRWMAQYEAEQQAGTDPLQPFTGDLNRPKGDTGNINPSPFWLMSSYSVIKPRVLHRARTKSSKT